MVFAVAIVVIWMLYDSTFCSYFSGIQPAHRFQLPSSVQERFEPPLAFCSLDVFCSWLCVSQLGAPKGSSYLGTGTVAQAGSARAGAPWRAVQSCPFVESAAGRQLCTCCPSRGAGDGAGHTACCARGQSACSSHCHLPQMRVWHKLGASSSLSLINLPRNERC